MPFSMRLKRMIHVVDARLSLSFSALFDDVNKYMKYHTLVLQRKIYRIIHGRAEIWNLSSSVQIDIERVSAAVCMSVLLPISLFQPL